jgi:hypothetical protein
MAYPEEIIEELAERYALSEIQQQQLRECLMIKELRHVVEANAFDPSILLIQLEEATVYIPSPSIIGQLLKNTDCLSELKKYVLGNPAAMKEYIKTIEEISRINSLRLSNPRERTERKILLRQIGDKLESLYDFVVGHAALSLEVANISRTLLLHLNAELKWLQKTATLYFRKKFTKEHKEILDIFFLSKIDGVQMGNRMSILYLDKEKTEHQIVYYIKTHQYGSLRSGGSTIKPVDFKEPFVYRALEYAGFGPKAHFFFNSLSPSAFFIATQDEEFTKALDKVKFFKTYGQARKHFDSLLSAGTIADEIKIGIARADILLRILNLWDIISNSGNYGYTSVNQAWEKWRVIDFRVGTVGKDEEYCLEDIFEGFRDGRGMDGYIGLPNTVLTEAEPTERVNMAASLIEEFEVGRLCQSHDGRKMPLREAMEKAYNDIRTYIMEYHESLQIDLSLVLPDLEKYFMSIQKNLTTFIEGVISYTRQAQLTEKTVDESQNGATLRPL